MVPLEICMLSNNIHDYYFVSQGKTTIPSMDDGEECNLTDVSVTSRGLQMQKIDVYYWEALWYPKIGFENFVFRFPRSRISFFFFVFILELKDYWDSSPKQSIDCHIQIEQKYTDYICKITDSIVQWGTIVKQRLSNNRSRVLIFQYVPSSWSCLQLLFWHDQ